MINVMTSSEQGTKAQLVKMVIGLNGWFRIPDYLKDTDEILRLCHYSESCLCKSIFIVTNVVLLSTQSIGNTVIKVAANQSNSLNLLCTYHNLYGYNKHGNLIFLFQNLLKSH